MIQRITILSLAILSLCALPLFAMDQQVQVDEQERMITLQADDGSFSVPERHMMLCKLFEQESDFNNEDSGQQTVYWPIIRSSAWKIVAPQLETIFQLAQVKKRIKTLKEEYLFIRYGLTSYRDDLMSKRVWDTYKDTYDFTILSAQDQEQLAQRKRTELRAARADRGTYYSLLYDTFKELSAAQLLELFEVVDFCEIPCLQPILVAMALRLPTEEQQELNATFATLIQTKMKSWEQTTTMHWACSRGVLPMVQDLVEREKCPLEQTITLGLTPLHCAAQNGHGPVVAYLLGKGACASSISSMGHTPLSFACQVADQVSVTALLDHRDYGPECVDGETLLHDACLGGNPAIVEAIYRRISWRLLDAKNKQGCTPLHQAVHCGRATCVQFLLGQPVDVNTRTNTGWTPLHTACDRGDEAIARLLVDRGASINSVDESKTTPLHDACANGNLGLVRYLTSLPTIRLDARDRWNATPLQKACKWGKLQIVRFLMEECERGFEDIDNLDIEGLRSQPVKKYLLAKKEALKPTVKK